MTFTAGHKMGTGRAMRGIQQKLSITLWWLELNSKSRLIAHLGMLASHFRLVFPLHQKVRQLRERFTPSPEFFQRVGCGLKQRGSFSLRFVNPK